MIYLCKNLKKVIKEVIKILYINESHEDGYVKGTPIPEYIYGILIELAQKGYIMKEQVINAEFLNKIHLEELIDIDKIGKEVQKRIKGE